MEGCNIALLLTFQFLILGVFGNDAVFRIVRDPATGDRVCAIGQPDRVVSVRYTVQCAVHCDQQEPQCTGFNFYKESQLCELYWGTVSPILTTGIAGCFHYRKRGVSMQPPPLNTATTELAPTSKVATSPPVLVLTSTQPLTLSSAGVSTVTTTTSTTVSPCNPNTGPICASDCHFPFTRNGGLYYACTANGGCYSKQYNYLSKWLTCYQPASYSVTNTTSDLTIATFTTVTTVTSVNNWLVFQQRIDSSVSFYVGWNSYKAGFGTITGNYWMGLEKIYQMTNVPGTTYRLRIEYMIASSGLWYSEEYDTFKIDSESTFYTLHVPSSGYTDGEELLNCPYSSPMYVNNGMHFTTTGQDHDKNFILNCADKDKGGWWYNECTWMNPNGDGSQFWTSKNSFMYPTELLQYTRIMMKLA